MKVVAIASLALMAQEVSAHGYLAQPAAKFKSGITTSYITTIDESVDTAAFGGKKWNDNPTANAKMFKDAFANSKKFKTLKALVDATVPGCGETVTDGTPVDVSGLNSMKWQNDQERKGLIDSHSGPCEGWIDNTKVFHYDDCRASFTAYPAEIPVDYSKCKGNCQFTFYWLALHEPKWQIYKQCAAIKNGSGGGGGGSSTTPAATTKPTADGEYDDEYSTPAPTKKNCKAKRRALSKKLRAEEN
ncbi:hypothetical protein PybrP1_011625 [[Pythium] brassicae (nom. inval.)]|nr:hypothetical protein PybrP1_011625 [[Pythium] brassicae (nom. inval.)]